MAGEDLRTGAGESVAFLTSVKEVGSSLLLMTIFERTSWFQSVDRHHP
jgi:hypothetical protein